MPASIEILVNRWMLKSEQQRKLANEAKFPELGFRPVIAISREYGSGRGLVIGRLVAEQLRFDFYEKNLVEQIAASAHVRARIVESLDERLLDKISEFIANAFETGAFTGSEYLHHLSRVVLAIGHHGEAVIMGRGAQFILQPQHTLRVRLIASLEIRQRQIAEEKGITEKEARAEILAIDAERAAFCRRHFNQDVTDPANYDLILNYGVLSPELCAELIERAFRGRFMR